MKRLFTACFILSLLTGCQKATLEQNTTRVKTVDFHVVQKQLMTRAALADACTVLDYFRYTDGELEKEVKQTSEDEDFGSFADEMPWGTHDLYFIGHKSEVTELADGVASFEKVSDTFTHYISLTVDEETETSQTVTLLRRVAKFELVATDAIPEYLNSITFRITGGSMSVDVSTGIGGTAVVQEKTIVIPKANLGKTGCSFGAYVFLPEGVTSIDVTAITYDAEGNELVEYVFEDVEVEVNYITRYQGMMFGRNPGFGVSVDADWSGTKENEF